MILPLICNFNTVFQGYELLYSTCGIQGFINSFDTWTNQAGLETIAWNSALNVGKFVTAYDAFMVCDSNYNACGYSAGNLYSSITGWYVMNTTNLAGSFEPADIPVFLDGMIEGIGCPKLNGAKDAVRQVVADMVKLAAGDLSAFQTIVNDYEVVSEAMKSISLPELDMTKIAMNAVLHMTSIQEKLADLMPSPEDLCNGGGEFCCPAP